MTTPYDPAKEGARMDFAEAMSYGEYLQLDTVLSSQTCKSVAHEIGRAHV